MAYTAATAIARKAAEPESRGGSHNPPVDLVDDADTSIFLMSRVPSERSPDLTRKVQRPVDVSLVVALCKHLIPGDI